MAKSYGDLYDELRFINKDDLAMNKKFDPASRARHDFEEAERKSEPYSTIWVGVSCENYDEEIKILETEFSKSEQRGIMLIIYRKWREYYNILYKLCLERDFNRVNK